MNTVDAEQVVRFQRLGSGHVDQLHVIEQICFPFPWTRRQLERAFLHPSFLAFGLPGDDRLLAYVSCYHLDTEMEILNLAVLPEHRRKGIGLKLMRWIMTYGRKSGVEQYHLEVRRSNTAAKNLYTRLGFRLAGVRTGYYPDNKEDALVMLHTKDIPQVTAQ